MKLLNLSLALLLVTSSCSSRVIPEDKVSERGITGNRISVWPNAVHYEIFVQSFADSNNDGIGDLNGITAKLDYLQDLGIKGLWLMPINPSPSYHKYDVTNYYELHPDYGTMADFKNLVQKAHKKDIRIIIDYVINHTGVDHPWFVEASKNLASPYRNYYVWANQDSIANRIAKKETALDSDNLTQWHSIAGQPESYYGYFYSGMPDLNYDNPELKAEIFKSAKFWLQEVGVDGFRLDAARHIFPDDRPEDNWRFWQEFRTEMESVKPDVFLVGEVWAPAKIAAPYLKGLHSLFNFDLGYAITNAIQKGSALDLISTYNQIQEAYKNQSDDYIDATFLTNHDQNRIVSELGNNVEQAKLAACILLTLPGAPFVYYGEEIGMRGQKPDEFIREPFLWSAKNSDLSQTKWLSAKYSTTNTVNPLSAQIKDSTSLYTTYRNLIHLRNEHTALNSGNLEEITGLPETILAYKRQTSTDTLVIMHNLSADTVMYKPITGFSKTIYAISQQELPGNIKPYQSLIFSH